MSEFKPGDDLVFQIESGYGLLRILAIDGDGPDAIWHLLAYDDFFPDIEHAEERLQQPDSLAVRQPHMALTNRAFERTPVARLTNHPVSERELAAVEDWRRSGGIAHDRSALLMLGIR